MERCGGCLGGSEDLRGSLVASLGVLLACEQSPQLSGLGVVAGFTRVVVRVGGHCEASVLFDTREARGEHH